MHATCTLGKWRHAPKVSIAIEKELMAQENWMGSIDFRSLLASELLSLATLLIATPAPRGQAVTSAFSREFVVFLSTLVFKSNANFRSTA